MSKSEAVSRLSSPAGWWCGTSVRERLCAGARPRRAAPAMPTSSCAPAAGTRCLSLLESKGLLRGTSRAREPLALFPLTKSLYWTTRKLKQLCACVVSFYSEWTHEYPSGCSFKAFLLVLHVTICFQSSTQGPTCVTSAPDSRILYSAFPVQCLTYLVASVYTRKAVNECPWTMAN